MALRDQPYLPLYIQDVLTDEKLIECSPEAHGVYFRLLCILHKQDEYGKIQLKAKYKQDKSKLKGFSEMLSKQMPFTYTEILDALEELVDEKVLILIKDTLLQKRMVKDSDLSQARAKAGAIGGKKGRNSGIKRYYNEPGYLYLMYDKDDPCAFKVGISAEPEKRIKGIAKKTERANLAFRRKWQVHDMGETEQLVLDYYDDIRDGEWIYGEYSVNDIEKQIYNLIKSKTKANSESESESESEIVIKGGYGGKAEEFVLTINNILNRNYKLTDKLKPKVKKILTEYELPEIEKAVKNAMADKFHIENGCKHLTPEFFTRSDKVDMWINATNTQKPKRGFPNDFDI